MDKPDKIKEVPDTDLKKALQLVNAVFTEFVAKDYSDEGKNSFNEYLKIKYDEVLADKKSGHKKIWGYYEGDKIIGVIAVRDSTHIALFFVDKSYHKKGIAKALFKHLLNETSLKGEAVKITVNSSPYAVEVYEKLGFVKTAEKQEKNGIIYIPMQYS